MELAISYKRFSGPKRGTIFYPRGGACREPELKGLTIMVNSIYNGWRYEDAWLDR
jgi:peptide/nickel transport system substrate-binding protein